MKKYTKEITALLTLVTAGVIGGSVYAADTQEMPPTAGVPIRTEETEPPVMGDMIKITDTTTEETEPPLMGKIMPPDTDAQVTTTTTTCDTTPMMGTEIPVTQTTVTELPIDSTPLMGDMMPPDDNPLILNPIAGRGDITQDGVTDLSDLLKLSLYVLRDIKFDEVELIEADMTMDREVDIADLAAMRMKLMTPHPSTPSTDDNNSSASMTINRMPEKTEYIIGEPLDLKGTVISAHGVTPQGLNWDIFSHEITPDDTMIQVYSSSFNNKVPGTYTIVLNYRTGYKPCYTSFTVTVTDPNPSSVSTADSSATMILKHGPDKTEYKKGESLDLSGLAVFTGGVSPEGVCWDGDFSAEEFDDVDIVVDSTSFNNQVPGTYKIKVSYDCGYDICYITFDVTVTE